jgi:4-hydroxy-tetrahydrodipicolinate reductase
MRVGVIGSAGRMGRMVVSEILASQDAQLAGGLVRPGSACLGQDLGLLVGLPATNVTASSDAAALAEASDVLIDFSSAEMAADHARLAAQAQTPVVICVTGLTAAHQTAIDAAAAAIPIVQAANTSVGVNLLALLVQQVAGVLEEEFDIEIVEMHHRHKADAPSGTALLLAQAAAAGRGVDLADHADRARDGMTGPRVPGRIGMAAMRGGDVVGDHSVYFAGPGERIVLSHLASDRRIYAKGALRAARWLIGQPPGRYAMSDVLAFGR